jgi:hypothetical protein
MRGPPLDQIVLGVPAYRHAYYVTLQSAFVAESTTQLASDPVFDGVPPGDAWNMAAGVAVCGQASERTGTGIFDYWGLSRGPQSYDGCSQTVRRLSVI